MQKKNKNNRFNYYYMKIIIFIFLFSFLTFCIAHLLQQSQKALFSINNNNTTIRKDNDDKNQIRLVVFDMGDTLWTEKHGDERAISRMDHFFYMIDENHMFFRPNITLELFPGVRELFQILYEKKRNVSICSINDYEAYQWIEKDLFDLNKNGFIKHSRIGYQGNEPHIKGRWILEILQEWNANETKDNPIQCNQTLFVDDNPINHQAVQWNCPGIRSIYPIPILKNKNITNYYYNYYYYYYDRTMLEIIQFL